MTRVTVARTSKGTLVQPLCLFERAALNTTHHVDVFVVTLTVEVCSESAYDHLDERRRVGPD